MPNLTDSLPLLRPQRSKLGTFRAGAALLGLLAACSSSGEDGASATGTGGASSTGGTSPGNGGAASNSGGATSNGGASGTITAGGTVDTFGCCVAHHSPAAQRPRQSLHLTHMTG